MNAKNLIKQIEAAKEEAAEAKGRLEQIKSEAKEKYGVDTLNEIKDLREEKQKEADALTLKLQRKVKEFNQKYNLDLEI